MRATADVACSDAGLVSKMLMSRRQNTWAQAMQISAALSGR